MTGKKITKGYRNNFLRSFGYACRMLQDDGYIFDVHYDLADFAQTEIETGSTHRMLVIMPRGSYKTTFITKFLSVWLAVKNPNIRILIVSNTMPNAKLIVEEIRSIIISSPIINGLFPEVIPNVNNTRWSNLSATLNRDASYSEGTFEAAGIRSRIVSRHYDLIIEDDTVAPELDEMDREVVLPSRENINQAIGWHKLATPLLVDAYTGMRIVVGTRWCNEDLIEYVQENEAKYKVFTRKAVENGEPIISKFDEVALEDIKESMGSYMFRALYLNAPVRPEDMIFRPEWIMQAEEIPFNLSPEEPEYDPEEPKIQWIITVDPAISDKGEACDTAIIRCGHIEGTLYVSDCFADKYTPKQTIQKIIELIMLDPVHTKWIGVEAVAYQKALALFLRDEMNRQQIYKPVMPIQSRTNKDERIHGLQPFFENGQIIIRKGLDVLVSQLVQYPHGKLIDCVDALAMQLESYQGYRLEAKAIESECIEVEDGTPILPENTVEELYKQLTERKNKGLLTVGTGNREPILSKGLR